MKRILDIVFSCIILLLFLPFGLTIALFIVLESKGGVFYLQQRVGRYGKEFWIYKFRTMSKNADSAGKLTVGMRDPRITTIGYFLRKFKLDEFPQFLNVLKGEMSVVGPRPEVKEYVELYTVEQREILTVRPGITDLASLEYFEENELLGRSSDPQKTYIEEIMPAKILLNKKYSENPSLLHDVKIIWATFRRIFR
jgi:lipopolysaccharide/colanic/teichoic acid biosynthesis glycosyltransferase